MAKSNKLQNVKAIKQMLDGTHRTQTRKSFHFWDSLNDDKNNHHQSGDVWYEYDSNGEIIKTWFQLSKYRVLAQGKWDSYEEYINHKDDVVEMLNPFSNCIPDNKDCTQDTPSKLDRKLAVKTGMCDSCLAKYELKRQISGDFDDYAMDKMRNNLKSWIRDQRIELDNWKESLRGGISYLNNGDADEESWGGDVEMIISKIEQEFSQMKSEMYKNYGIEEEE